MTLSTTTSTVILNANGTDHNFTFNFKIIEATDLKVIVRSTSGTETEKTLNSHYIIPTVNQDSGGNVLFKFNTGNSGDAHYSATDYRPANGEKVILRRTPVQDQDLNLVNNDPFNAELIETSLDKLTMQVQALQEEVDRSFRLSRTNLLDKDGAQINNAFFQLSDDVATRKGKYLQFNSTTGVIEPSATSDDVTTLAAVTTDIALLADIQDGTSATNTLTVVSGISGNVTTCASISSDITSVAGISSNVTTVAGKASLITSDFATDMSLVTSDFVTDMNLVTSDFITDMNLVTSDFVADMALVDSTFVTKMGLVTSDFVTDMSLVTADFVSDVNTLATSDIVSDLNTLATSDIVSDLNTLATADIVSDLNTLATTDIVSDLNQLATSDFVSDLNAIEAIKANVTTVAGVSSNVTTVAGISSNVTTVAGISANVTTVAGANSNISTVASNISGVNSFAERYRVDSSDPSSSLDEGDLFYNSSDNSLKYYNGSSWQAITPVTTGISSGNVPVFTSGVSDNDFLKVSSTSIEGRSASEVLSDIGAQAALTFGISNTNAVKVDSSSVADDEYARFTSNGLESRSPSEVASDIGAATTGKAIAMAMVFG
tara:strand:- start:3445 stop:5256 length:1812 start_codon:yes stop_codon:yes gene_type:complete